MKSTHLLTLLTLLTLRILLAANSNAAPVNLAPLGSVSGSSQAYGSVFQDATDDNRDGNFYSAAGSVWHTNTPDTAAYLEVDLGGNYYLDRVQLWPRTDALQGTVTNFTIQVTDAANAVVWTGDYWPTTGVGWAWGTSGMRGVQGRKVRFLRKSAPPNFLTFAEMEVLGSLNPPTINYARAPGVVTTASAAGFGTTIGSVVDGDLNANYATPASPRAIYHSAATAVGNFYQLDLGQTRNIDYVTLYARQDSNTTGDVKLSFRDAANTEVHSATVNLLNSNLVKNGARYDVTYDPPAIIAARTLRIETITAQFLALAEVEIFGQSVDITPPLLSRRYPDQGALVAELNTMDLEFNEAITGFSASDLLINGVPATGLTAITSKQYLATFTQPANGLVTFTFANAHGITDLAGNPFVGTTWSLTISNTLPAPQPFISEIMAENKGGLDDEDDDSPDWIELYNPGPTALNLGNWYLSDTAANLIKWRLPSPTILEAGEYLIVFASSKDRAISGLPLHTNFKLDPDGESVILVKSDGVTIASQVLNFPKQEPNISFGNSQVFVPQPLLAQGSISKVWVPTGTVANWAELNFDDSAWTAATLGVGFDQSNGLGSAGPLGWWNFDDASTPATALDVSGNARNGTVTNAVYSADAQGRTGLAGDRSVVFAGNGVIDIPAAATGAFDAMSVRDALTISLWINGATNAPVQNFTFFGSSNAGGTSTRILSAHLPWSDSVIYWDTSNCCDAALHRVSIGEPDQSKWKGQWNHYAFVKNRDVKQIWQNGLLLLEASNTADLPPFRSFFIGAQTAVGGTGYSGSMDDFAMWDGALDEGQIAALANGASPQTLRLLTPLINSDIASQMRGSNATVYVRVPFQVANPSATDLLKLRVRYDDGFVAYLNGVEVTRRNAPTTITATTSAASVRPSGTPLMAEDIDISRFALLLQPGNNVLAIQGLNASVNDAQFLLLPELYIGTSTPARFFPISSPGTANGAGYTGFVNDVKFTPQRGFYTAPTTVTLSCSTPGATIVYTTDGTTPTLTNGTASASPASAIITGTTNLRATAFAGTLAPTNVDTHTYLFVSLVADQQRPASAPAVWPGNFASDFTMDARVPGASPAAGYALTDALLAMPSLCLTCPPADLWGANGIYTISSGRGMSYERLSSAEWLDPAHPENFHVNAGLRIHGNISRNKDFTPKHGFSLRFRGEYGDTRLNFPLFPDSAVTSFDELVLRAGSTDTFPCTEWAAVGLGLNGESYQRWNRDWASYLRDQWSRDAHLAMGQADFHGRYCHLYLNGLYWGIYNITESPGAPYMADHLGGTETEWDTVADFSELHEGTRTAWDQLLTMANSGQLDTDAGLRAAQGLNADGSLNPTLPKLLNVDSLIDYMILSVYIGSDDWPNHNWWGARRSRGADNDGFHFFLWDQEISNVNTLYGKSSWGVIYAEANADGTPTRIYSRLRNSAEFRTRFADRINRHLFNTGALTQVNNVARWNNRVSEIDQAIVAESSRWGDAQANHTLPGQPYTRENTWLPHLAWMDTNYWPNIPATALQRFRTANLYPAMDAPVFSKFGGLVTPTFSLMLTNPNTTGDIIYTTDGTDPRLWGGTQAVSAQVYTSTLTLSANVWIKARIKQGTSWSALTEAYFPLNLDLDNDAMADAWELIHGLSSSNAADALLDSDHDGQTNLQEYAANTDPQDGASTFLQQNPTYDSITGVVSIEFQLEPNRTYILNRSDDLTTWKTKASWGPESQARTVIYTETPEQFRHFYKLTVTVPSVNP
jgi:hypothetical protein